MSNIHSVEAVCRIGETQLHFNPYSAGIEFCRQILTTKVDPRTVRVEIFLIAVDP